MHDGTHCLLAGSEVKGGAEPQPDEGDEVHAKLALDSASWNIDLGRVVMRAFRLLKESDHAFLDSKGALRIIRNTLSGLHIRK